MTSGLRVDHLCFSWAQNRLFDRASLFLPAGIHWLRGANGTGKSTLLSLLGGKLKADAGTINLDSLDIHSDPWEYRSRAFLCSVDQPPLPWLTAMEFVELIFSVYRQTDETALMGHLNAFHLSDALSLTLPALSLGQSRKLMLAVALALDVNLLLLDEPFNALDHEALAWLRQQLADEGRRSRQIIVLASHIAPEVPLVSTMDLPFTFKVQ